MAKLRGAAKAAFLRRMARGRKKMVRKSRRGSLKWAMEAPSSGWTWKRRKPLKKKSVRRRNPLSALIANPGGALVPYGYFNRKPARRRKKKGVVRMARKRRKSGKRRARKSTTRRSPVRRRRRKSGRRRVVHLRKRGHTVVYANPTRRRRRRRLRNPSRRRRVHRRRNPGMSMGGIKGIFTFAMVPYLTGIVTSGLSAMLDSALATNYPSLAQVAKVGGVVAIAAFVGKKHPRVATSAIAAIGATQGYALVTKLTGGMVAHTPAAAVQGLAGMSQHYPEMGALLNGGLGALLNGPDNIDNTVSNYETALTNMADEDD